MIDTADLLQRIDLERLIGADTALRGGTGRELHGGCPFCPCSSRQRNHTCDRFRLNADRDRWYCRHCTPLGGTAIDYLMQRDNLDFREACRALGAGEPRSARATPPAPAPTVAPEPAPSASWQAAAEMFVADCAAALWTPAADRARAWLQARGLADETLRRWHIGYCAATHYGQRSDWGTERDVSLPRGITIPWLQDGVVWAVKVRLPVHPPARKYHCLAGSKLDIVYGNETIISHKPLVLLESELDAVLLEQAAGDLVAAGSLNGTRTDFTRRMLLVLRKAHPIYVAYDADDAGQKAARQVIAHGPRFRPVTWPAEVHDLADLHQRGHDIHAWVAQHLPQVRRTALEPTGNGSPSDASPRPATVGARLTRDLYAEIEW